VSFARQREDDAVALPFAGLLAVTPSLGTQPRRFDPAQEATGISRDTKCACRQSSVTIRPRTSSSGCTSSTSSMDRSRSKRSAARSSCRRRSTARSPATWHSGVTEIHHAYLVHGADGEEHYGEVVVTGPGESPNALGGQSRRGAPATSRVGQTASS
jgi:hypothetical protein